MKDNTPTPGQSIKTAFEVLEENRVLATGKWLGAVCRDDVAIQSIHDYHAQFTTQPTEAEINEAAVNNCPDTLADWSKEAMHQAGFKDAIQWFKTYQQVENSVIRNFRNTDMPAVQPIMGVINEPKYRVGNKQGQVILSLDGKHEIGRIHDVDLALKVCSFLNQQPQPNPLIEVVKGKIAELESRQQENKGDGVYFGLLNIKIEVLQELLKQFEQSK